MTSLTKRLTGLFSLTVLITLGVVGYLAGLVDEQAIAQAQIPTLTPTVIWVTAVYPPRPPTPTSTPIPDDTPPVMTLVITGQQTGEWYQPPISLTFVITDDMSGPRKSWYRFAGETEWRYYENGFPPVIITRTGTYTVNYYADDWNYNIETPHTTTIKVMSVASQVYLPLILKSS